MQRVFIMDECKELMPSWLRFVKGVVDAQDLPLNVSREILQESRDVETIRSGLTKRVLEMLSKLAADDADKYRTFWKEFGAVIKEGVAEDPANRDKILALLRFASDPSIDPPLFVSEPDLWADIFPLQTPRAWRMDGLFEAHPDLMVSEWRTMKTTQQVVLPDPRPIESVLHLLTCATIAADEALMDVDLAAKKFGTSALSPALATQLHATSEYSGYLLNRVDSALEEIVKVGRAQRETLEKVQAERLVQMEDRIVVLGDRERPHDYFIIGATPDDTLIAVCGETAQIILIIGAPASGKTYLGRVIAESLTQHLPGLSTVAEPQRVIQSEVEFGKARGRRQCLSGFEINANPDQQRVLREVYSYCTTGNEAYRQSTLLVLPEHVEPIKEELAPLVERGLVVLPAELNPRELGVNGYLALLSNGQDASQRSVSESRLADLISTKGPDVLPQDLLAGLEVLDPRVRAGMAQRLKMLQPLVKHGPWLSDCLLKPGPVFMLLESTTLPQDLLMSLQAVSMISLSRPLSDGSDPYRLLHLDEYSKMTQNVIVRQTTRTQSREHRHNRAAICANGQQVSDFDEVLVSNATIVAIGYMTNQNEIRLAQTLYAPLRQVPMREFLSLQPGEFIIAAINNTGKHLVYRVKIRPTVLRAGGETCRVR